MGMAGVCLYLNFPLTWIVDAKDPCGGVYRFMPSVEEIMSHFWVFIRINLREPFHNTRLPGLEPQRFLVSCSGTGVMHLCSHSSESHGEFLQHTGA